MVDIALALTFLSAKMAALQPELVSVQKLTNSLGLTTVMGSGVKDTGK